jgi:hypothetical protein
MKPPAAGDATMSSDARKRAKRDRSQQQPPRKGSKPNAPPELPPPRPLKPRPGLFVTLLILFALWTGFLIWMYVKTVYPTRGQRPDPIEPAEIQIIVPSTTAPTTQESPAED